MSGSPYETDPAAFWQDLAEVGAMQARGGYVAPEVIERQAAHDAAQGYARRDGTVASFGALVPTAPATGAASGVPSSRRPFVDALASSPAVVPFPTEGMALTVPVSTTAGVVGWNQTGENFSTTESTVVYTNASATFSTAVARVDLSRQAFERGAGMGEHLTRVVRWALDTVVEQQVLASMLASSSFVSLTSTAAVGAVRATIEAGRQVAATMQAPPDVVVLNPRRWGHWAAEASTTSIDSIEFTRSPLVGSVPVIQSAGVTTVASTSQDRIHVTRWDGLAYAEDAPRVRVVPGGPDAGAGVVSIIGTQYYALVVRYPGAIQSVSGSGLIPPAAF